MGLRGDAIVQFDWSVGQIMATLERLGIADNTSYSSQAIMVLLWTTAIRTVQRNSLTATSLPGRGVAISIAPSKEVRLSRR